jgi:hypothetical protein
MCCSKGNIADMKSCGQGGKNDLSQHGLKWQLILSLNRVQRAWKYGPSAFYQHVMRLYSNWRSEIASTKYYIGNKAFQVPQKHDYHPPARCVVFVVAAAQMWQTWW